MFPLALALKGLGLEFVAKLLEAFGADDFVKEEERWPLNFG